MNEFSTETTRPYVGRTRVNVLFIEDDAMNRRVVKDMLDVAGAAMVGAEDAEQGLALVEQQAFAVALVDLRMPGMEGLSAIRHIRAREDETGRASSGEREW